MIGQIASFTLEALLDVRLVFALFQWLPRDLTGCQVNFQFRVSKRTRRNNKVSKMSRAVAAICASLDARQFGSAQHNLIVFRPVACGLGGQINGRVLTLALALALDRRAVFLSLDDKPYGQVFEPLNAQIDVPAESCQWDLVDIHKYQADQIVCYDPLRVQTDNPAFNSKLIQLVSEQVGIELDSRLALEGAIMAWMRPTEMMRLHGVDAKERLGVDNETLGVHFRRGDKAVESAYVPASAINAEIARMYASWQFSKLFLASDSPAAPDEIICPDGVLLIFDDDEPRYNNANHKMLLEFPELVQQETRAAFKNIYLLSSCGGVIGQHNSHFATLAAANVVRKTKNENRIILIDGRMAENNSIFISIVFRIKRKLRSLARYLFPRLTMQAKMARKNQT